MKRTMAMVVVVLLALMLAPVGAHAQAQQSLVGQWTTQLNGQQVVLNLNPDGTAELMGQTGNWQASGGSIVLSNAQGQLQGVVQGGQLVFSYGGQQFVYSRAGAAPAPAARPAPTAAAPVTGGAFKPPKTLPGRTVTPEGTQMQVTIPEGWTGAWTKMGNLPVYALTVPGMQGKAMLGATASVLGDERNLPMATLLPKAAALLWGQAAAASQPVLSESFSVGGHAAGRIIYRATVPNPQTGQQVQAEGYIGLVLIDDWAFGFVGLYDQADSDKLRAGLDTMLASLRGTPPARNVAMEAQLVGCWEAGTGTAPATSKTGSAFTSAYIRIGPGGRYSRSGGVSVSTATDAEHGGSVSGESGEQGSFTIHGNLITWRPAGGGSYANVVGAKPGGLYLDGKLWIKCI